MKTTLASALTVILALCVLRQGWASAERLATVCELRARGYFGLNR